MVSRFIRRSPQWRIRQKIKEKVEPSDGGPTVSPQTSPPSEQITKEEYLEEVGEQRQQADVAVSEYQQTVESIEPQRMYIYQGQRVPGYILKKHLQERYGRQVGRAELLSQQQWQQARDLPRETSIIRTDKGYEFKIPDQSLRFTEQEFKKIEQAPPGVKQVAEFGFGATSSFAALGKPVAPFIVKYTPTGIITQKVLGVEGKPLKPVHYVSPIDVAFEPIGLAPKGSTKILRERPIFTAGGISGEILQSAAATQVLKPVGVGAKTVGKFTVRKIPKLYTKVSKVLPEENIFSKGISKGKKIIGKGSSELPENIGKWSRGYQKVYELTSAGVKGTPKKIPTQGKLVEKAVLKTKYGKGGVRKVWVSPKEYTKIQTDIAGKLSSGKVVDKSSKVIREGGMQKLQGLEQKTSFSLSATHRRLLKKYSFTRRTWNLGTEEGLYKIGKEPSKLYKGYQQIDVGLYKQPLKESEAIGMRVYDKTGKFVGYKQPLFFQKPSKHKWIGYRPPFLKNIEAQAVLAKTQTIQKPVGIGLFRKTKSIGYLSKVRVPATTVGLKPILSVGAISATKSIKLQQYKPRILTVDAQRTKKIPMFKRLTLPRQRVGLLDQQVMDSVQAQKVKTGLLSNTMLSTKTTYIKTGKVVLPKKTTVTHGYPFYPYLPKKKHGLGAKGFGKDRLGRRYRFRKFNVKDLLGG